MHFQYKGGLKHNFRAVSTSADVLILFVDLLREFHSTYTVQPPLESEDGPISTQSFSTLDVDLLKDNFKFPKVYSKLGQKYNHIYSFYRSLIPNQMKKCLDHLIGQLKTTWFENQSMNYLKDFGTFLMEKVLNHNYPLWLQYFIELHMLSGYDTYAHRNFDIKRDTLPFTVPRKLSRKLTRIMKKWIARTIDLINIGQFPNLNFEDFVKYRDNWNLMGSATIGLPMKIFTEGFRKATRIGSKTTNLIYYSDEELLKQLYKFEGHVIRPFLKTDEAAKARVVIGYDTRSYIRCSYLEQFILDLNGKEIWTTVGMNPTKLFEVRKIIDDNIKTQQFLMVCTDQAAFDQHVYKDLFVYAFNYLCERILRLNPQVTKIIELENYGMKYAQIYYPDGSVKSWMNGLLSGHKFTALLGSVLNRASTLSALELAQMKMHTGFFQGDDALIMIDKASNYQDFLKEYKTLDLVVNPMKTWHNTSRTEYLHQIYGKQFVVSLASRAALGGLFRDPKAVQVGPEQTYLNTIDQMRMMERRGLDCGKNYFDYTLKFVSKFDHLEDQIKDYLPLIKKRALRHRIKKRRKIEVFNFLHTPTLYGGGGFEPYVSPDKYYCLQINKNIAREYKSSIITPYHYAINDDAKLTENWILKKIYDHLPMPHITTNVTLVKVDRSIKKRIAPVAKHMISYNFDRNLKDNSWNWYNHVKESLGLMSPFGEQYARKFSSIRSYLNDSFNLISNVTNAFLGAIDRNIFNAIYMKAIAAFVFGYNSKVQCNRHINYWKNLLYFEYRSKPPDWYNYGFFF